MSRESIKETVIHFLEQKNYQYLKPLGEGGYASVIAVISPQREVVAVKIVEKKNVWVIEDQVWPRLNHRNILPVLDVLEMDEPAVKLYVTPMLPKALYETILSNQFRKDPDALTKLKLWMYDTLSGVDNLHSSGLCHGDLKTDNVLIDEEERAVLCDFSGLNYTGKPLESACSPFMFRPPECFDEASQNIQGVPYDMYTFGLMALNMLTDHWPQREMAKIANENWTWSSDVLPILREALRKSNFESLMRKALPYSDISKSDVEQALDFILSMLKLRPDERASAQNTLKHQFLKIDGNPFISEKSNNSLSKGHNSKTNPFQKVDSICLPGNKKSNIVEVKAAEPEFANVKLKYDAQSQIDANRCLLSGQETALKSKLNKVKIMTEENPPKVPAVQRFVHLESTNKFACLLENVCPEEMKKKKKYCVKKSIKQKVTEWFRKKFKK